MHLKMTFKSVKYHLTLLKTCLYDTCPLPMNKITKSEQKTQHNIKRTKEQNITQQNIEENIKINQQKTINETS